MAAPVLAPDRSRIPALSSARPTAWVAGIAALAVLARVPFLARPLGSDEGGFLLVASQWSPGSSLYGSYWVDRPPLLIDFFALADVLGRLLGTTVALRCLGLVVVAVSVVLAGRIGRLLGGSPVATAAAAAIFLVNPLLGTIEVNGELIATPVVLGGFLLAIRAVRARSRRTTGLLLVAAGAVAAAAALVKQNELDVVVLLAVGAVTFLRGRGWAGGRRVPVLAGAGAVALTGVVLLQAAALGTGPLALWDAVVTFRLDAAAVISASATEATTARLHGILLALLVTGAPLVVLQLLRRLPAPPRPRAVGRPDLRWATVAVLAWETVSVVGGGSYWLHYLICLVPGLVLAVAVTTARGTRAPSLSLGRLLGGGRRVPHPALAFALASCLVTLGVFLPQPGVIPVDPVVGWLRGHVRPGDTAVVAFGHPDYLTATGLTSPYSELWSLPVRVRDPDLRELTAVLDSSRRPDWVVTGLRGDLTGWGIDATRADTVLAAHYREVADLGSRHVYLDRSDQLTS